jgi:hypothetical protein
MTMYKIVFSLALGLMPVLAFPAVYCATTVSELQLALVAAAINDQDTTIRIANGTYAAPPGGFVFDGESAPQSLTLSGGWSASLDGPCGQRRPPPRPDQTVLDGGGSERVFDIWVRKDSDLTIELLTIMNGSAPSSTNGGGLRIRAAAAYAGTMTLERNLFLFNEADKAGAAHVRFNGGTTSRLLIVNNVLISNHSHVFSPGAIEAGISSATDKPGPTVSFINNTVENNTTDTDGLVNGGVLIEGSAPVIKWVANNNLWGNDGADLLIALPDNYRLENNNIQFRFGNEPEIDNENISVAPVYVSCGTFCIDREPVFNSPLVDAGLLPSEGMHPWHLPDRDVTARPRIKGPAVDIGAYENQERLFVDRFESEVQQ